MTAGSLSPLSRARTFLRYGYVPEPKCDLLQHLADDEFIALKRELEMRNRSDLLSVMDHAAVKVFGHTFADLRGDILIPMSGGRDSRFILCMAIAHGLRDRITALTWGVPGGLDHAIAAKVCAHLGVRHERIDTRREKISYDDLKRAFHVGAHWTDLQWAHFNQAWYRMAPNSTAIIGYLGGPPIGCHYQSGHEQLDIIGAISVFEALNRRGDIGRSAIDCVPHCLLSRDRISLPEQLDLIYRQEGYLRRIVAPPGLPLRTPFAHPLWLRTTYALPAYARLDGNLFSTYLEQRFPKAFALGTSGAYGLRSSSPMWARRVTRKLIQTSYVAANAMAAGRERLTFDKYGDPRDLIACLRLGEAAGAPRAYVRALQRADTKSLQGATEGRLRAILVCNHACANAYGNVKAVVAA